MLNAQQAEDKLLKIPSLPLLLQRLRERLEDEQAQRAEFRSWLDPDMKAEFINGAVVLHSPASEDHNEAVLYLGGAANAYCMLAKLGKVRVEKALVGMTRNDYEPAIAFWAADKADGFQAEMNVYPVPDWVVEVLSPGAKNRQRDLELKFDDYAAHGVREYWIVDPKQKSVTQYLLAEGEGRYELHKKALLTDTIASVVLAGFSIPVRAIFEADANAAALRAFFVQS